VRRAILGLGFIAALGHLSISVSAQGYRWWQSGAVRRELELTAKQVDTLEALFVATLDERRALRRELDRHEEYVRQLLVRGDVDDTEAFEAITRLEATRARRNAARTMMLFRMYRVLSTAQRRALKRLTDLQTEPTPPTTDEHLRPGPSPP
jgi:Spy/CpxP family protein refolding chaperone